jgi:hypothetical protein
VTFVDASDWAADDSLFADPLHLSQHGAALFSQHIGGLLSQKIGPLARN